MTSPINEDHSRLKRNLILGLRKVDWSDVARQNEYLHCVISAMEHLGTKYDYDHLACVSGCAFRACSTGQRIHPDAYHIMHDMPLIVHSFKMLGYNVTLHPRSDAETDKKLIMDSIDKGVPVLTFGGVVNCSECCIISGYDDNGAVLLGYSPFMYIEDDHNEPADSTGYFRKSNWHDGFFEEFDGRILIIGEPMTSPSKQETIKETLKMAAKLIRAGYAGSTYYAELVCNDTDNWRCLELMVVCMDCNVYQDKLYVAPFLREATKVLANKAGVLEDCAGIYDQVSDLRREMSRYVADDLSTGERILDKDIRRQYAERVYKIRDLEKRAADLFEDI
jgi:hypothetical protein